MIETEPTNLRWRIHLAQEYRTMRMWKELYDNAEEGSEEQAKYYEEWQEAQSNLNDAVVEHINLLKKDYSALKQSLTEMFGDPDIDEYEYDYNAVSVTEFAVWYIDNDIVTLTLHKYFVWNEWSASLLLEIEHTTQIQSVVQDSSFKS